MSQYNLYSSVAISDYDTYQTESSIRSKVQVIAKWGLRLSGLDGSHLRWKTFAHVLPQASQASSKGEIRYRKGIHAKLMQ